MTLTINNVPQYAYDKKYIVARNCDGDLWFWGAWDDQEKAQNVAQELDGVCIAVDDCVSFN